MPSLDYRRSDIRTPDDVHAGLDAWADAWLGRLRRGPQLRMRLTRDAARIDALATDSQSLADSRLRQRLAECRAVFRRQRQAECEAWTGRALAAVREAAGRCLGLRPYPVQIMGCLALHRGVLAEMATGEGKTLVAGMAAVLSGWTRNPCHIVTVNDYLAQRDAEWLGPLYRFCGLSVGFVTGLMEPAARRHAHACDVTCTTSKELVADFLRDRLALGRVQAGARRHIRRLLHPGSGAGHCVMRGLHTAIVDEADSVLVDEAVTPLIISRKHENAPLQEACRIAQRIVADLQPGRDYRVDRRYRDVELRLAAEGRIAAQCAALPGIWRGPRRRRELVRQALTARELFRRGVHYVVESDEIRIVDEFTGRVMPGRTWREGLHQAIEAKEGLVVSSPSETLARLSFQRFFRLFAKLSGMTGTAREAAAEFWHIYRLPVVAIPTHRPCRRHVIPDQIFADPAAKWSAVADTVLALHLRKVPVLVGTRSVAASEALAARLREMELPFNLLNAVRHREEARVVAEAGQPGRITIATNMAGRGTDIRLGRGVAEGGGLHVLATERHEAGRIDRQLFGRCARQGVPGTVHVFVSVEDELLTRFLPRRVCAALRAAVAAGQPGARRLAELALGLAQRRAQQQAFRQRQQVLRMDTWIDEALSFAGPSRFM